MSAVKSVLTLTGNREAESFYVASAHPHIDNPTSKIHNTHMQNMGRGKGEE